MSKIKNKAKALLFNLNFDYRKGIVLGMILLMGVAGVTYAQFARQDGDLNWGYGYGYGYGQGYGWDQGEYAGYRTGGPADPSEYSYGEGYGYLIEDAENPGQSSWIAEENFYRISSENLEHLAKAGILQPDEPPEEVNDVTFWYSVKIVVDENIQVTVPEGAILYLNEKGPFHLSAGIVGDPSLPEGLESFAAMQFGLPEIGMTSSVPITISIDLDEGAPPEGTVLDIYRKPPTGDWLSATDCMVDGEGVCEFTSTQFSEFAVTTDTTVTVESEGELTAALTNSYVEVIEIEAGTYTSNFDVVEEGQELIGQGSNPEDTKIEGDLSVQADDVTIENMEVTGTTIVESGHGITDFTAKKVELNELQLNAGGEESIVIEDAGITTLVVNQDNVNIVISGDTDVTTLEVNATGVTIELEEGLSLPPNTGTGDDPVITIVKEDTSSGGGGTLRYTVTLEVNDEEMGTVEGEGRYRRNTDVTVTASPEEDYYFSHWEEYNVIVSEEKEYTFSIKSSTTLRAVFTEEEVVVPEDPEEKAEYYKEKAEEAAREVEKFQNRKNRIESLKGIMERFVAILGEDHPQAERLTSIVEAFESMEEELDERLEEAKERLEQAQERAELAARNKRLARMQERLEFLLGIISEENKRVRGILETMMESVEEMQEKIQAQP